MVCVIPAALLFIAMGLLCGSVFTDKQVGGICGALLTNLAAWLSGTWFDLELVGGAFKTVAYALPFVHAVEMERAVIKLETLRIYSLIFGGCLVYAAVTMIAAVLLFLRQMKKQ